MSFQLNIESFCKAIQYEIPERQWLHTNDASLNTTCQFAQLMFCEPKEGKRRLIITTNHSVYHYITTLAKFHKHMDHIDWVVVQDAEETQSVDPKNMDTFLWFNSPIAYCKPLLAKGIPSTSTITLVTMETLTTKVDELLAGEKEYAVIAIDDLLPITYYMTIQKIWKWIKKLNQSTERLLTHVASDQTFPSKEVAQLNAICQQEATMTITSSTLPSGYSKDVHGQMKVRYQRNENNNNKTMPLTSSFHYKMKDGGISCFKPGVTYK